MANKMMIRAGNEDRWMEYHLDDGSLWAVDELNGMAFAGIPSLLEWCEDEARAQGCDMSAQELLDEILAGTKEERMSELYDWLVQRYEEAGHGGLF